jgi:hypothetical protein
MARRRHKAIAKIVWRDKIDRQKFLEVLVAVALNEQRVKAEQERRPKESKGGVA